MKHISVAATSVMTLVAGSALALEPVPGGAPQPPSANWVLDALIPTGGARFLINNQPGGLYPWVSGNTNFALQAQNGGPIELRLDASAASRLRWTGAVGQQPDKIFVRLSPQAIGVGKITPLILVDGSYSATRPSASASVGRFTLDQAPTDPFMQSIKAFGPTYKEASVGSGGLALVPVQSFLASVVIPSGEIGELHVSGIYAWQVLPPFHITYLSDGEHVYDNYGKGQDGSRVLNVRDRNGRMTVDTALHFSGTEEHPWYYKLNLMSAYGGYQSSEIRYLNPGPNNDGHDYGDGRFDLLSHLDWDLTSDDMGQTVFDAKVSDNDDNEAPNIPQEIEVRWHLPYENYHLVQSTESWMKFSCQPAEPPTLFEVGPGKISTGRYYSGTVYTFEYEHIGTKLVAVIKGVCGSIPYLKGFGILLQMLGSLIPDDILVKSHLTNATFEIAWVEPLSEFEGRNATPPISEKDDWVMKVGEALRFDCKEMTSDSYSATGYQGTANHKFAKYLSDRSFGFFRNIKPGAN